MPASNIDEVVSSLQNVRWLRGVMLVGFADHGNLRNSGRAAYNQKGGIRRESICEFLAVPAALTMRSGVTSADEPCDARTTEMGPGRGIDRGQDPLVRRHHGLCSGADPYGLAQPLGIARIPCPRCGLRGPRLRVLEAGRGLPQTLAALRIVHGVDLHRPSVLPRYRARQSVSLVLPAFPDLLSSGPGGPRGLLPWGSHGSVRALSGI